MKVIAHRGANREALENSWSAFTKAVEAGADRLELDIHFTTDGHFVILHDDCLKRTDGSDRLATNLSKKDLQEICLKNGEKIPFLEDVLAEFLPKIEINIEIKSISSQAEGIGKYSDIVEKLASLIKRFDHKKKIIVSSFALKPLVLLYQYHPEIERALLWEKKFSFSFWSFMCISSFMKQCGSRIFHPEVSLVNINLIKKCKNRGWSVFPYCEMKLDDQEELWTKLAEARVDGLCTNRPREMVAWIRRVSS